MRAAAVLGRGVLWCVAVVVTTVALLVGLIHRNINPDPDEDRWKAPAGAAWAGFPDVGRLSTLGFRAGELRGEGWHLAWKATAAEADRVLGAAAFAASFEPCRIEPVPDHDRLIVRGCRTARDSWTRPDGNVIERRVVRGSTLTGTEILYLHVVDPG